MKIPGMIHTGISVIPAARSGGSSYWTPSILGDKLLFWGKKSELDLTEDLVSSFTSQVVTNNVAYVSPEDKVLADGHTIIQLDASATSTITKDGSTGEVSEWRDKQGSVRKVSQATATKLPIWTTPGTIAFDGSNDFMQSASMPIAQPIFIYIVMKQYSVGFKQILTGLSTARLLLDQNNPKTRLYGTGQLEVTFTNGTWYIWRGLANGASSKVILGEGTAVTGTLTYYLDGLTIGAGNTGANAAKVDFKEIIIRDKADSSEDEATILSYLKTKYSL